jgi:predicted nucleic acid-binding Zn ribbon protein
MILDTIGYNMTRKILYKVCAVCAKEFEKPLHISLYAWKNRQCCSKTCKDIFLKGRKRKHKQNYNDRQLQHCIKCGKKMPDRITALCTKCTKLFKEEYKI